MDIKGFIEVFQEGTVSLFGSNLLFLGLQGSHGRGEATAGSDIDPAIILSRCGRKELLAYRAFIDSLPEKEIICGFVSSLDELRAWDSADRAQLILDTIPIHGSLASLVPPVTEEDVRRAVLQGSCAIYHAASHCLLHERDWTMITGLYKSARFTIRMRHYLMTGKYIHAFRDLAGMVSDEERRMLTGKEASSEEDAFCLLEWASRVMQEAAMH